MDGGAPDNSVVIRRNSSLKNCWRRSILLGSSHLRVGKIGTMNSVAAGRQTHVTATAHFGEISFGLNVVAH